MKVHRFFPVYDRHFRRKHYLIVCSLFMILFGAYFVPISSSHTINNFSRQESQVFPGQILFAPLTSKTTYLIDRNGSVNHTWLSDYLPYYAVYMLDDGTLLRSIKTCKASHGGIEKYTRNGTIIWHYEYYLAQRYETHHDFKPLPNGHILMIARENKTRTEAINAGRDPAHLLDNSLIPDYLVEIEQTGPNSGAVVWEWHAWDHLIQDYDTSKKNYGVVADHPELMDINYGGFSADWLHCNSVAYNEKFDQIIISFRNINETWIIDHSTTTEEAAGHTGGNSEKGGDILYRWGNPQTYNPNGASHQKLYGPHDPQWIKPGYPGEGHILIFNNGFGRGYSSVDEIIPPVDETGHYYLELGSIYGPEDPIWSYTAVPPTSFYAEFISGAQRLPDGNTLICDGPAGRFFEVTPEKNTIWEYTNPYPNASKNFVFKIQYIPPKDPQPQPQPQTPDLMCFGSLSWINVRPGETISGSFQVQNIGDPKSLLNWTINISSIHWGTWTFAPHSGTNLTPEVGPIIVQVTVVAPSKENTKFKGCIQVENRGNATDFEMIPISLTTQTKIQQNIGLMYFFHHYFRCFSLLTRFGHVHKVN